MKCVGKCRRKVPPSEIVWLAGKGGVCRLCFPGYTHLPQEVRDSQIAAGLPSIKPRPKSIDSLRKMKKDIPGQDKLWKDE